MEGSAGSIRARQAQCIQHHVIPPVNLFKRGRGLIHRGSLCEVTGGNLSADLDPINPQLLAFLILLKTQEVENGV